MAPPGDSDAAQGRLSDQRLAARADAAADAVCDLGGRPHASGSSRRSRARVAEFVRDERRHVTWLRFGGRLARRE